MIRFDSDYVEGAHARILDSLLAAATEQNPGYGTDSHCQRAADLIRSACHASDADVHFLVGGTQTNTTVIAAALRPHQGVISADTGHIFAHETGAIESAGHRVITVPGSAGKLTARQIVETCQAHWDDGSREHVVQPGMVYISHPTEWGTVYTLEELEEISQACRTWSLPLMVDGARLGYGLCAEDTDVTLSDLARLCDVFYIGGTKVGALFGEAVVICNDGLKRDFRYLIKQRGGMLAKGWLLGLQFETLFSDGLYLALGRHAVAQAERLGCALQELGIPQYCETGTNQLFPILPDEVLAQLEGQFAFTEWERLEDGRRIVRFCTSWATPPEHVDSLIQALRQALSHGA